MLFIEGYLCVAKNKGNLFLSTNFSVCYETKALTSRLQPSSGFDKTIFGIGQLSITSSIPNEVLLGREHATIQDLQPDLNFPFIQRWFCPRRGIFTFRNAGKPHTLGLSRVFRKLRKAQRPGRFLFPPRIQADFRTCFRDREEMWQLLCDLGSNISVRFEAEKKIRTYVYNLAALCSLRKEPVHLQMSACKAIDSALRFKGFEPPRLSAPLTIPFLSGPKLRSVMRQVLRFFLSQNLGLFLPFYVPKTALVTSSYT